MRTMKPTDRIRKARMHLILDQPFFGTLVMKLKMVEDDAIDTACTNGIVIRYNPRFIDGLSDAELECVLAHEVLHVANGHCWRRGERDASQWNEAADYAINSILQECRFRLPTNVLLDPSLTGSAERIYSMLPTPPPSPPSENNSEPEEGGKDGKGSSNAVPKRNPKTSQGKPQKKSTDPGRCGGVEDAPAGQEAEQKAEWQVAVAQATQTARQAGKLPAGLERSAREFINPVVPWQTLLRDFIEQASRNDYNWARPNRRYLTRDIILPSMISSELRDVVLAIDTSGSITEKELQQFASEVSSILQTYEATIHLVYCDAKIHNTMTLTRADLPLELKPIGGGGTDFRPVFDWVEKEDISPSCLIYLTDLYGAFPKDEPEYPVLWISTTQQNVPFGHKVEIR